MDVKLATLIKSLNIMDVIFSGFTVCIKFHYILNSKTFVVYEIKKVHTLKIIIIQYHHNK